VDGVGRAPHFFSLAHRRSDAAGNAVVVWCEPHGESGEQIVAVRHAAGPNAWSTPIVIGTEPGGVRGSPRLALDPRGAAIAVWPGARAVHANTLR